MKNLEMISLSLKSKSNMELILKIRQIIKRSMSNYIVDLK